MPEERASSVGGKLRFAAQRPRAGEISKDILPFPLSFCPTAAEISLSLEAGRAQLGQAEGAEAALDEYIQEAGLEAWTFLVTWALNFVYSGRHGDRAERPETSWNSEMDTKQFEQQSSQVLCLSANIHFTQKVVKYMQNGQLLLNRKVQRTSEWDWFRQLRYYLKTNCAPDQKPAFVRMLECEQSYSFEYQGNASKLVHTPLTDKCYLTLMHGMHLGYGGNPYGPGGTGKTASVKALGACLGRQVLVFKCGEGIDFQAMGRIFIGLVRCGALGCFDEFNRLLEEPMSAISQSVQLIQAAIKTHAKVVSLLGREITVNHNAGIFITMNPATKGCGGRQKLPDNLKQLFRPVAMSVPDNELIAEVMMFAEGFKSAKILDQRIVALFLLSRQLLSMQQHYKWGLRSLKPTLSLAGRLLQDHKRNHDEPPNDVEEAILLIKAVRMNTMSKLTFADARRFHNLCVDLFPGVTVKDIEYAELEIRMRGGDGSDETQGH